MDKLSSSVVDDLIYIFPVLPVYGHQIIRVTFFFRQTPGHRGLHDLVARLVIVVGQAIITRVTGGWGRVFGVAVITCNIWYMYSLLMNGFKIEVFLM